MKRIGLLSDTHGYMDDRILHHLQGCDEIWHAGDWGNFSVLEALSRLALVKGVYGNIDGQDIRLTYPLKLFFECERMKILMIHIAGTPGKYFPNVRAEIQSCKPDIFICGHSHILKIMRDEKMNCLYMNPGAAGRHGFHKMRTLLRFELANGKIDNLNVVELGQRAAMTDITL